MKLKINEDKFYTTTADTLSYYIENNGSTIFNGKAFKSPDESNISINITKICRDYLKNQLPDFRGIAHNTISQEEAYQSFSLYTYSASTEEAIPVLLETYDILYDWDYDLPWTGQSMTLSNPINGRMDKRMKLFYTVFKNVAGNIEYVVRRFPIIKCVPKFIYAAAEPSGYTITITSNIPYTLEENLDWVSLSANSGDSGITSFVVSVPWNLEELRSGVIHLKYYNEDNNLIVEDIHIKQEPADPIILLSSDSLIFHSNASQKQLTVSSNTEWELDYEVEEIPFYFNVSPLTLSVPAESGSSVISVSSNIKYSISTDANWITLSADSGTSGETTFTINYTATKSTSGRTATVLVSNYPYGFERTINITQQAISGYGAVIKYDGLAGCYAFTPTGDTATIFGANLLYNIYEDNGGELIFDDEVTMIGYRAFLSNNLTHIYLPNTITSIGEDSFESCWYLENITIPSSVTSIGNAAFADCRSFTSITIPSSVTSIGNSAFLGCENLSSITIPDSVTSIGNSAFLECTGLTSIVIPQYVTSIGTYTFRGCTSLSSVTIGNSVASIGYYAFMGCTSLSSITIPDSVTSIGGWVFRNCTSLYTLNYDGTMSQWDSITKTYEWNADMPATVVHCSDGDINL